METCKLKKNKAVNLKGCDTNFIILKKILITDKIYKTSEINKYKNIT